ncbi:MAG: MBL fold metallo-hydrolase [Pseudomonadota bacterium]
MLCRIGDVEIWRILELNGPFLTPETCFPNAGAEAEEIVRAKTPEALDKRSGKLILPVQGFLLKTPDHVILVDACVGNHKTNKTFEWWHMKTDGRFMAALTAAGVGPEDVDYVLCTHLHADHVGWNTKLEDGRWVPTFPNARYLMPGADNDAFSGSGAPAYNESVLPVIEAGKAELVSPGHQLGDHVTLVPTPGHTPGHVAVLVKSGDAEAVITGDAMHVTAQCWRPEWEMVYDQDGPKAAASRRRMLEDAAEARRIVLGMHFTLPSIGRVEAEGDAFRWVDSL